jgi:hypothetical protein
LKDFPQLFQNGCKTHALHYTWFRNLQFYFIFTSSIDTLSAATAEAAELAEFSEQFRGLQITAFHGASVRKSMGIYTFPVLRIFDMRGYLRDRNPRV